MFLKGFGVTLTSYTKKVSIRGIIFTATCLEHGDLAERTNEDDIERICLEDEFSHIMKENPNA